MIFIYFKGVPSPRGKLELQSFTEGRVIHHGGIGTIAQCLRAGVPALLVPGGMDQPFNAAQVVQRKAGVWIPRKHYTTRRAEQALKALLFTPTYIEHVREIQAHVLQEDGVATLCAAVEQVLRDFTASPRVPQSAD